jgi:hypothetical protein
MASFALTLSSRPYRLDGILVIRDERTTPMRWRWRGAARATMLTCRNCSVLLRPASVPRWQDGRHLRGALVDDPMVPRLASGRSIGLPGARPPT